MENVYCRLCAEPNALMFDCDETKCNEIHIKLSFLNASYVDFISGNNMSKSVCYGCYESLNRAYEFLDKVKKAQDKLKVLNIFPVVETTKLDFSDDDRSALDAFFGDNADQSVVKEEKVSPTKINVDIEIKQEPKEEFEPGHLLQASIRNLHFCENSTESHIINDILETLKKPDGQPLKAKVVKKVNIKSTSWSEYIWLCGDCHIEFADLDILRTHCKAMHNKCASFSCIDCKMYVRTDDFNAFVQHVRKHRKGLSKRCHYCDEIVEDLNDHVKVHLTSTNHCKSCGEQFLNKESLKHHLSEFVTVKRKRKPRRKKGDPITVEELTCNLCNKVYSNPNSLRDHKRRHTSDGKRNYTCDRCGKTFLNKGTLTTHVMLHEQIRPHVCRICNKSFVFPNMLRRHVEVHSGIKPFSCEICGRCFRLPYQLKSHKIVHTDSMPYVCQYCNKAFRFKQILKNHERQHTGAKPYSCDFCCMEFSNWSNYNKHMKRRHNMDTSKKKITPTGVFPINPETGQLIHQNFQGMEEWKSKLLIPAKRGKKSKNDSTAVKEESNVT